MAKKKDEAQEGVTVVSLTMSERLNLLATLPSDGAVATVRVVSKLREALLPDEGELESLPGYKATEGGSTWNAKEEKARRFTFSGWGVKLIVERLQKLDKEEKLQLAHLPLWEKFVEAPAEEPKE